MGKCLICGEKAASFSGELGVCAPKMDENIPYTLLAFYPCYSARYVMNDLPTTSKKQALECQKAAEKHLKNTRIGNIHLLS